MTNALLLSVSILILAAPLVAQEVAWSEQVNGLRARLSVLPSDKAESPFCRVMIEIQNVDNVMGQKRIRFNLDRLELRVRVNAGTASLDRSIVDYDGFSPVWDDIFLPFEGTIKFRLSFPGAGYSRTDKVIIDMGHDRTWIIPQNGAEYLLSGNLTIDREKGDHPVSDWHGTLVLPSVKIPKAK